MFEEGLNQRKGANPRPAVAFLFRLDFYYTITSSIISGIHNSYFRRLNGTENQVKNSTLFYSEANVLCKKSTGKS